MSFNTDCHRSTVFFSPQFAFCVLWPSCNDHKWWTKFRSPNKIFIWNFAHTNKVLDISFEISPPTREISHKISLPLTKFGTKFLLPPSANLLSEISHICTKCRRKFVLLEISHIYIEFRRTSFKIGEITFAQYCRPFYNGALDCLTF